jgi:hypothetical protein
MHLLEANQDKIHWPQLSSNPAAIHLLFQNQDKINWTILSQNSGVFEYDYQAMTRLYTEELMANRFHPDNLDKFKSWGF